MRELRLDASDLRPYELGCRIDGIDLSCHRLQEDADVYLDGRLVAVLRKNRIDNGRWKFLRSDFNTPVLTSDRRKTASNGRRELVRSGVLGYIDHLTPQMKKELGVGEGARMTAFCRHFPERWTRFLPLVRDVDRLYRQTCPRHYAVQKSAAQRARLTIEDTVFSTITVNQNWQSGVHTDSGDFVGGMSCLVILGGGYRGGWLVLPRLGVVLKTEPGDIVFMDAHEPHGNTPIEPRAPDALRMSLIFYLREKIHRYHKKIHDAKGQVFHVISSSSRP